MKSIEEMFSGDVKLPSLPAIALRIIEAVKTDESSFSDLSKIVSSDPALTTRVLRVANSSFYAVTQKIDSIQKALTFLGTETLKNIALSFVIVKWMNNNRREGFDYDIFWKRAVTAAVAADLIAEAVDSKSDDLFIASLLQDIGIVIIHLCMAEKYQRVFDEKRVSGLPVAEAEKKILNFDHQEVGTYVLKKWGLPESIYLPIRYHHHVEKAFTQDRLKTSILWLADKISAVYHGKHCAEKIKDINRIMGEDFGLPEEAVNRLIDAVAEESVEILSFFEIDAGDIKPYSQILLEANEELEKLNISYAQLIIELKRSKEEAENLARRLQNANERLREMATKDGLTGLNNHRFFQEALDREISGAVRYRNPLSLILLDIDHFKKINDTYGHQTGDLVLKEISAVMADTVRDADIVARYGGEEFAAILPETDIQGAAILAERLRRVVEKTTIQCDGQTIQVTISLGATTLTPRTGIENKTLFIGAADKALYHSKSTGRNRISLINMAPGSASQAT